MLKDKSILMTSFTTWKPHHVSNSSDDLLGHISDTQSPSWHFLRKLPVDFQLAPRQVISRFNEFRPDVLICCGMAEERKKLSIESRAVLNSETIETDINLDELTYGLGMTEISHDTGQFVCNTLYFKALKHLHEQERRHHCIFAHVPLLTSENAGMVRDDFLSIVERLSVI
jgi:pyroglutamyl-peptidase